MDPNYDVDLDSVCGPQIRIRNLDPSRSKQAKKQLFFVLRARCYLPDKFRIRKIKQLLKSLYYVETSVCLDLYQVYAPDPTKSGSTSKTLQIKYRNYCLFV